MKGETWCEWKEEHCNGTCYNQDQPFTKNGKESSGCSIGTVESGGVVINGIIGIERLLFLILVVVMIHGGNDLVEE